jgi:UDP-N-acetyl-D-glucosamine dehydrogenase
MGLRESIEDRSAIVGVIGMGYVGLPLALQAGSAGFKVVGLEKDDEKRERLARGDGTTGGQQVRGQR